MPAENAPMPLFSQSSRRLSPADVPIGEPLAWAIVAADGTVLFDIGSSLTNDTARAFLFRYFEPLRADEADPEAAESTSESAPDISSEPDSATADGFKLDDIGLEIGARLGLRRLAGSSMYSSRVIGFSSAGSNRTSAVFVTQPVMSGYAPLELMRGEQVELVALTSRAVFRFVCTVDSVWHEPFHYLVLSEPGAIGRLRARKFARMSTRLVAHFSNAGQEDAPVQLGLIRDISPFGMSLTVAETAAKSGDRLRVSFRFSTDGVDVPIEAVVIVRHVHADGPHGAYGLEFESLDQAGRIALKAFMAEGV
jgi:hypothetical protein